MISLVAKRAANKMMQGGVLARKQMRGWFEATAKPPPRPSSNPTSKPPSFQQQDQALFDVAAVSKQSGVRLTQAEIQFLRTKLDKNNTGFVSMEEFRIAGKEAMERQWARELCLTAVEQPTTAMDRIGTRLLQILDIGGKTLFAVVGTQVAGEAGMNVVGCTLVGCISCLGGGTLNNLLYGTGGVLGGQGVVWVRNPTIFYFAVCASILTFYTWPVYCRHEAKRELRDEIGKENLEADGSVGKHAFSLAVLRNENFKNLVAKAVNADPNEVTPQELFEMVDTDGSGYIEIDEMQSLVGNRFNGSSTMYFLDSMALSALAVTAVHMAITRGLTPMVAATSGITICFGGILRDVLCGRHLALGGQSYALATGAGSSVYILLRELSLKGYGIPLVARIMLSAGTTMAVRVWEYWRQKPLLQPMHSHPNHIQTDELEDEFSLPSQLKSIFDPSPIATSSSNLHAPNAMLSTSPKRECYGAEEEEKM